MDVFSSFNVAWDKFRGMCRAKFLEKSKSRNLTPEVAEKSVKEVFSLWLDPYHACGQFLKDLSSLNSASSNEIKQILYDIKFEKVPVNKGIPTLAVFAIALIGAAAGFAVSHFWLQYKVATTVIISAVTGAAVYYILDVVKKNARYKAKKDTIANYMKQLDNVKDEIAGLLKRNFR